MRSTNYLRYITLSALVALVAIWFGLGYGSGNQNTYLIDGMVKLFPDFLANDWLARETHHYHPYFSYVIWFISSIGLPLDMGLMSVELLLRILGLLFIYKIIRLYSPRYAFPSFLSVLFLIVLEHTKSVGDSYIFSEILQPSSFGSAFTLIGLYYFLNGTFLLSGIFMAFAGLMHTNFLLLSFVYLGMSHMMLGKEQFFKRCLKQFTPLLIIFLLNTPTLLSMISAKNGELATYIFQFIRSPHHYLPLHYLKDFTLFAGWSLIGLASLSAITMDVSLKSRFNSLYTSLLVVVVMATSLTTIVYVPLVSKLFFWRLAPFSILLSQLLFVTSVITLAFSDDAIIVNHIRPRSSALIIGTICVLYWYVIKYSALSLEVLLLILFAMFMSLLLLNKYSVNSMVQFSISIGHTELFSICLVSLSLTLTFNTFYGKSSLINGFPGVAESKLYEWCKNTPKGSTFLVPPNLQNFRLHAERAIVVDWKSTPIDPDGLIEWYNRLQDVSGVKDLKSAREADTGYLSLNRERLNFLKTKYTVNYAVLYNNRQDRGLGSKPVFENDLFTVVAVDNLITDTLHY